MRHHRCLALTCPLLAAQTGCKDSLETMSNSGPPAAHVEPRHPAGGVVQLLSTWLVSDGGGGGGRPAALGLRCDSVGL